jgi:hypothetical protein
VAAEQIRHTIAGAILRSTVSEQPPQLSEQWKRAGNTAKALGEA